MCAIRQKIWAMILKHRFIGSLAVQRLTVSVIRPMWMIPRPGFIGLHVQVLLALLQPRWSASMNFKVILMIRRGAERAPCLQVWLLPKSRWVPNAAGPRGEARGP